MGTRFDLSEPYVWWNMLGLNPDVDTATVPEDVWGAGGLYAFPAAAAATTIESDSAADASAGTGARTVLVTGLNASYLLTTETATMDGVTPVSLANQYLRILRATVQTVGSGQVNAGTIAVKQGATTICTVPVGYGESKLGVYTVPADYSQAYLMSYYFSLQGSGTDAQVVIQYRENGKSWRILEVIELESNGTGTYHHQFDAPPILPARTDLRATVLTAGANNTVVSCGAELALKLV